MLLRAMTEWPIDAQRSLLIGDKPSDIEAAARAGIAGLPFSGGNLCDLVRRSILTGV
jgi:D-glycero-D-manno-heptose 1,7-bisphosphate phosphatase